MSKIYEALRKAQTENEGKTTGKPAATGILSQNVGAGVEEGPTAPVGAGSAGKAGLREPAKGIVPEDAGYGAVDRKLITLLKPESLPAEQFRKMRAVLSQLRMANGHRSTMITSAVPGEGKTLTACNLSVAISQGLDEKAILIDCDLRRPTVHTLFGTNERPGLGELLEERSELSEVLHEVPGLGLKIVPAGRSRTSPAELLSSEKMADFLSSLKVGFEDYYVILDTTPLLLTSETGVLARHVDGILLVIMFGGISRDLVKKAVKEIPRERFIGVIFNNVRSSQGYHSRYGEGYYHRPSKGSRGS